MQPAAAMQHTTPTIRAASHLGNHVSNGEEGDVIRSRPHDGLGMSPCPTTRGMPHSGVAGR